MAAPWQSDLSKKTVDVLPLVRERNRQGERGWCTYVYEHAQAPEMESICGGINSKSENAGAIWRQGNLLHFGFQPAPDEMNAAGRALLVNSIVYISRFTDDRPIVRPPRLVRLFDRDRLARLLRQSQADLDTMLPWLVDQSILATLKGKNREEIAAWYKSTRDYLHADAKGQFSVDVEAQKTGLGPARPDFLEKAIIALRNPESAAVARRLLNRYAPEGPGQDAKPEAWETWCRANQPALFFSDVGGYRWYVDPLAKKRGVATASLRGAARATLPAPGVDATRWP